MVGGTDPIHTLSVKTAAASRRLAELKDKQNQTEGRDRLTTAAVAELESAIGALQASMEHLRELQSELGIARQEATTAERRYDALRNALPLACVVTDRDGTIVEANAVAVVLLNMSERHLVGKPLFIFLEDRDRFLATLNAADELRFEAAVRPRDRKSRDAVIHVHGFEGSEHRCVFLQELDSRSLRVR